MAFEAEYISGRPTMAEYTPGSDLAAGTVVVVGNHCRIAHTDLKSGKPSGIAVGGGIYRVKKATGADTAIADGVQVYWDNTPNTVTATAGSLKKFGITVSAAGDSDEHILVLHMPTV